jgi:hypothetical protein
MQTMKFLIEKPSSFPILNAVVSTFFDLQLPPLAPNISCFPNHRGAVLFFFLDLSLPSSTLQWPYEEGKFLLRIWPIQLTFLLRILFRSVLFSPIRSSTCSLVTFSDYFIFSILLQHQISKLSKYFRCNFLSTQVSDPYKGMLQT